jgi:hypothetical protein
VPAFRTCVLHPSSGLKSVRSSETLYLPAGAERVTTLLYIVTAVLKEHFCKRLHILLAVTVLSLAEHHFHPTFFVFFKFNFAVLCWSNSAGA